MGFRIVELLLAWEASGLVLKETPGRQKWAFSDLVKPVSLQQRHNTLVIFMSSAGISKETMRIWRYSPGKKKFMSIRHLNNLRRMIFQTTTFYGGFLFARTILLQKHSTNLKDWKEKKESYGGNTSYCKI